MSKIVKKKTNKKLKNERTCNSFLIGIFALGFIVSIFVGLGFLNFHISLNFNYFISKSNNVVTNKLEQAKPQIEVPVTSTKAYNSKKYSIDLHFIHIPKCGGTSMTAVLRQVACEMNQEKNIDCCKNPGFCDWHAFRRCAAIKGCTDHFPFRFFKRIIVIKESIYLFIYLLITYFV
jgi:hypothetical protein